MSKNNSDKLRETNSAGLHVLDGYSESYVIEGKTKLNDRWVFFDFGDEENGSMNPSPTHELALQRLTTLKEWLGAPDMKPTPRYGWVALRIVRKVTTVDVLITENLN